MIMNIDVNIVLYILKGAEATLKIFAMTLIFSIPIGTICAIGKVSGGAVIKAILDFYTWLIRGTPLMLQLLFVFYGLPALFSIKFDARITAAYVAFIINYGAYFTEIFRGGIQSIDKGQFEAAKALGMSYPQTMWRIVIPQALKNSLPPLGNEVITLIKDTSLALVIAVPEIIRHTREVVSAQVSPEAFFVAAVIYLCLAYGVVLLFKFLEKKLGYYD